MLLAKYKYNNNISKNDWFIHLIVMSLTLALHVICNALYTTVTAHRILAYYLAWRSNTSKAIYTLISRKTFLHLSPKGQSKIKSIVACQIHGDSLLHSKMYLYKNTFAYFTIIVTHLSQKISVMDTHNMLVYVYVCMHLHLCWEYVKSSLFYEVHMDTQLQTVLNWYIFLLCPHYFLWSVVYKASLRDLYWCPLMWGNNNCTCSNSK